MNAHIKHEMGKIVKCDFSGCEYSSERTESVNAHIKSKHERISNGKVTKVSKVKVRKSKIPVDTSTTITVGVASKELAKSVAIQGLGGVIIHLQNENSKLKNAVLGQDLGTVIKRLENENAELKKIRSQDIMINSIKIIKTESRW